MQREAARRRNKRENFADHVQRQTRRLVSDDVFTDAEVTAMLEALQQLVDGANEADDMDLQGSQY